MARFYKLFAWPRTVFYTVFCAAGIILTAAAAVFPAQAAKDNVFTVQGVKVDITAENAADAREQAFAKAQGEAFTILAGRLLSEEQMKTFKAPPESVISPMVKDFELTDERLSSVRYIGTYTFRFKNDAVRNYLGMQGVAYTDVGSKPVLVLPFYQRGAQAVLWGNDNPWLAAWKNLPGSRGLVPVVIPIGDAQDMSDIADDEALTYHAANLQKMTQRYNAGETIIMLATPQGAGPDSLTIMLYRTDHGSAEFANKLTVTSEDALKDGSVFTAGVELANKVLQEAWKSQTIVETAESSRMKVRVRFSSMQEWVETQSSLRRVQGISEMKLISLTPAEATVELLFKGTEERLRLALAQADMTLSSPQVSFSPVSSTSYGGYGDDRYAAQQQPYERPSPLVYDLYLNKFRRPLAAP